MDFYTRSEHSEVVSTGKMVAQTYFQLAVTLIISAVAAIVGMRSLFAYEHPFLVMIAAFAVLFGTMAASKQSKWLGVALLYVFAWLMGYSLGPMLAGIAHSPAGGEAIEQAFLTTAALFVGLSGYAMISRKDFSVFSGFLITGLIGGILLSLLGFFFHSNLLSLVVSGMMILVFGGFVLIDTQLLMRKGVENSTMMVLSLYLDILNLFISLLRIFSILDR